MILSIKATSFPWPSPAAVGSMMLYVPLFRTSSLFPQLLPALAHKVHRLVPLQKMLSFRENHFTLCYGLPVEPIPQRVYKDLAALPQAWPFQLHSSPQIPFKPPLQHSSTSLLPYICCTLGPTPRTTSGILLCFFRT